MLQLVRKKLKVAREYIGYGTDGKDLCLGS